ncbi:S8 family peptidase [Granulicella sp. dw_53]|uniref:S8 family peptidase n=1 Tax=Granulicella sp. dw_53 TaxID=2719792 RepID=UPI001BD28508|nr:S8 family peptidase [Granulicella sp. dw_53]
MERRKKLGFGTSPQKDVTAQTEHVRLAVDEALAVHKKLRADIADPALIVRVRTSGVVPEEEWERAGLAVLGHDATDSVVLFASDAELKEFQERLAAFAAEKKAGQKNPSYNLLIASIEEFGPLKPEDRIGSALLEEGFERAESFSEDRQFNLDVELWDVGTQAERGQQADRMTREIAGLGGEVSDRYIGITFSALRVRAMGNVVRRLLNDPLVRLVDLPPQPDLDVAPLLDAGIADLGIIEPPDADAPLIAILDTGVNSAHPLLEPVVVGRAASPDTLAPNDVFGHGSRVSGIAAYGDVRNCLEEGTFQSSVRILSGKVINDQGNLDDRRLIATQINEIVRLFHARGCRIFNLSIGDRLSQYVGGRVGQWTAVLDELARELDVLFVVAAGNYLHKPAAHPEEHHTDYPVYLLNGSNRIFEPATAANALTVGAVAHAAAVPASAGGNVGLRPIAEVGEPAPFTCAGPGVNRGIKPDLCDDGGNILYDGLAHNLVRVPESEVFTTSHDYLRNLFTTARGTSCAAPLVTHKAALVLRAFPEASANLVRAFLANSARIPEPSLRRLKDESEEKVLSVCGYGIANAEMAATSDANRVVLYTEGEMPMDRFFVYEVPIPSEYAQTKGKRHIAVTLAFDPPTRHSRLAYLGVEMSFRLIRGKSLEWVREHYRKREEKTEGKAEKLGGKYDCDFDIGSTIRERGTLQRGIFTMTANPSDEYGETYFLVVRCERQWYPDEFAKQRFAVVVEIAHSVDVRLYERIDQRVNVRLRA